MFFHLLLAKLLAILRLMQVGWQASVRKVACRTLIGHGRWKACTWTSAPSMVQAPPLRLLAHVHCAAQEPLPLWELVGKRLRTPHSRKLSFGRVSTIISVARWSRSTDPD